MGMEQLMMAPYTEEDLYHGLMDKLTRRMIAYNFPVRQSRPDPLPENRHPGGSGRRHPRDRPHRQTRRTLPLRRLGFSRKNTPIRNVKAMLDAARDEGGY
jgi:hypothetical protein